jgi:hypothetical protein
MLSERVHGKYKFLDTAGTPAEEFNGFYTTSNESLNALLMLAIERADTTYDVLENIPSAKKVK